MGCDCGKDIHDLHAELIHPARDVQFQIAYTNGLLPATITDINEKNVQAALESYWGKVGLPIRNEVPSGAKNNVNTQYGTAHEFIPGSLEVYLSGDKLLWGVDFVEDPTFDGFEILLDPNDPVRLNAPPQQFEDLTINYAKRITFNTKGGT